MEEKPEDLGFDFSTLAKLGALCKGVSPTVLQDALQLAADAKAMMATPEGQKVMADLLKLASDFQTKPTA